MPTSKAKPRKLKPRTVIVGNGEKTKKITVRDQATLRLIKKVINFLPVRK